MPQGAYADAGDLCGKYPFKGLRRMPPKGLRPAERQRSQAQTPVMRILPSAKAQDGANVPELSWFASSRGHDDKIPEMRQLPQDRS